MTGRLTLRPDVRPVPIRSPVLGRLRYFMGSQPTLRVERCGTPRAGGSDRLSVGVVDHITTGEHAGHTGPGGRRRHHDVPLRVDLELVGDELAARVVADGEEHPGDGQPGRLPGAQVANLQPGYRVLSEDVEHLGVPKKADFVVPERPLLHDLTSPQSIPAVDNGDGPGKTGEKGRLLHRRVPAAHDDDVLVAEEEAVAGRACLLYTSPSPRDG